MSLVKIIEGKEYRDAFNRKHVRRKFVTKCDYCGTLSKEKGYVKKAAEKPLHFCNASCSQKHKFRVKKERKVSIYSCPCCDRVVIKLKTVFAEHLLSEHNLNIDNTEYREISVVVDVGADPSDIYNEYVLNGVLPKCGCGCGEDVPNSRRGQEYIYGHAVRVHNNWGHNPEALAKSQETRRQMFKDGKIETWCKGLTKETDERLADYGRKISETFDDEKRDKYSKQMRDNRLNGTVPTLYGSNHPNWKGGTSMLSALVYADHTLYTQWKLPILKHDNFTCTSCGSTSNLHVHHDDVMMSQIIHEHKDSYPDYDDDDFSHKKQIASNVVNHHIDNAISGITLCESCHKNVHNNLNF